MRPLSERINNPTPEGRRLMEHIATHWPSRDGGSWPCPVCDELAAAAGAAERRIVS